MRVITFSRFFPAYHPRKGEPTYFIEKIWAGLADTTDRMQGAVDMDFHEYYNCQSPKWHTIRAGNRWKVGDMFSPRYWSGKPYCSKQEFITEPLEIKKIWTFEIGTTGTYALNEDYSISLTAKQVIEIATNDGLHVNDFFAWFEKSKKPFYGQIICWNENINY